MIIYNPFRYSYTGESLNVKIFNILHGRSCRDVMSEQDIQYLGIYDYLTLGTTFLLEKIPVIGQVFRAIRSTVCFVLAAVISLPVHLIACLCCFHEEKIPVFGDETQIASYFPTNQRRPSIESVSPRPYREPASDHVLNRNQFFNYARRRRSLPDNTNNSHNTTRNCLHQ